MKEHCLHYCYSLCDSNRSRSSAASGLNELGVRGPIFTLDPPATPLHSSATGEA